MSISASKSYLAKKLDYGVDEISVPAATFFVKILDKSEYNSRFKDKLSFAEFEEFFLDLLRGVQIIALNYKAEAGTIDFCNNLIKKDPKTGATERFLSVYMAPPNDKFLIARDDLKGLFNWFNAEKAKTGQALANGRSMAEWAFRLGTQETIHAVQEKTKRLLATDEEVAAVRAQLIAAHPGITELQLSRHCDKFEVGARKIEDNLAAQFLEWKKSLGKPRNS